MAVDWRGEERARVDDAIRRHPLNSGRCAALARVVFAVGSERDEHTRGRQVRPRRSSAARFVVPKVTVRPCWATHTFVETHEHAVDGLTGAEGCAAAEYLDQHWQYTEILEVEDVDVALVDAGIEDSR